MDHIKPQWDIEDFKNLDYTYATHNDPLLVNEYLWAGHNKEKLSIYKYHEPNPMPEVYGLCERSFLGLG